MFNFKNNSNFTTGNYHHIFSLILLLIYYLLSIIFFKEIVVNPHDNLDYIVVYDHVIGNIINGNFDAVKYFLAGTLKWFYIENILYPTNLFHLILDDKQFYFTNKILEKVLSYFTFYILAKSISKNKFNNSISAVVYSSIINVQNLFGLGMVMLPYFLHLLVKKKKLKPKHFFIIIFTGLSSSLVRDYLALLLLIPISILIRQSIRNINTIIFYFVSISISIFISSIPIIISLIEIGEIHRLSFENKNISLSLLNSLKSLVDTLSIRGIENIFPVLVFILYFFILFISIRSRQKNLVMMSYFLILLYASSLFINPFLKNMIFSNFLTFLQGFNFQRIDRAIPLIIAILLNYNLNILDRSYLKQGIYFLSIFTVIIIQTYIPLREGGKKLLQNNLKPIKYSELKQDYKNSISLIKITKFLIDKTNYQKNKLSLNLRSSNTFDNYYRFEVYSFIKSIVKEDRVMSVGLDPMVAVMNDIKVIDGYHTIYSMKYKREFRKIIADELDASNVLKNYYDNWGNRVYAFYNDSNKLLINFKEAKIVGANYIISAFPIKNDNLELICQNCRNTKDIYLYKIL
jgi:hypothetical protein